MLRRTAPPPPPQDHYEFKACAYLAPAEELERESGHELAFAAIGRAKEEGHKLAFVLCSALTDMAHILRDGRWDDLAPGVVSHVVAMGGVVTENSSAPFQMDPDANNNAPDLGAARFVYDTLREDRRFWFLVVTRHAAAACQLPRTAFDGSAHPMARRLSAVMGPALQKLWERVHRTEVERRPAPLPHSDSLPPHPPHSG